MELMASVSTSFARLIYITALEFLYLDGRRIGRRLLRQVSPPRFAPTRSLTRRPTDYGRLDWATHYLSLPLLEDRDSQRGISIVCSMFSSGNQ